MSIPLHTTTVTVERSDQDGTKDALDGVTWATLATGVRAVISAPSGSENIGNGSSEDVIARLVCDPTDLRHSDRIVDDTTGDRYEVAWTRRRVGLGLDHTVADLRAVTDRAAV